MGIFARIFGSDEALKEVVKSASEGLDALVYTDEEKANAAANDRTEARRMVVEWLKASSGQNLARRLIALSITSVWLLQYVMAHVFGVASIWLPELTKARESLLQGGSDMSNAVMLILAFYFAAPHMGEIVKSIRK